jgi:dienelactone hydrolase
MKRLPWIVTILFTTPAWALGGTTCVQRSHDLLAALEAGHYAAATTHFDPQVRALVPAGKLKAVWETMLPLQFGAYDPKAAGQTAHTESSGVVVTPLHFAQDWLDMHVACNTKMEVSGLRFLPGKAPAGAIAETARKTRSGSWGISTPTQVASPLGLLPATLTLPHGKGPFAAVVLVAGSGAHDRDETIGPNKPFRDIARGLAAHGIASLRYDKRTFAYGAKMAAAESTMTIDDEVTDDALTAVHQLAGTTDIDPHRVFVLGHSLGAMMAPRVGKRDPTLAGLVLMAAPARSLFAVLAQQVREQGTRAGESKHKIATMELAITRERKVLDAAAPGHPPTGSFMHAPQSYWMSLHGYDQVAVARALSMPMLILQGGADFQVSPSRDFAPWKKIFAHDPRVTLHEYPDLSHLFMPAGSTGTIADYTRAAHVDGHVISDITTWIKAQPAARMR